MRLTTNFPHANTAGSRTIHQHLTARAAPAAQVLLAAIFLFAGVMKLAMPADELADQSTLPVGFLRFIAMCELVGAAGLILPGALRLLRGLVPLAAAGLVVIMTGAVVVTLFTGDIAPALVPLIVGMMAAYVVFSRRSWFSMPA